MENFSAKLLTLPKLVRLRENNWERRTLFVDVSRTSREKSQKINLAFNGICGNDGKQGASGKFFCSDLILGLRASKLSKFSRKLLLCTSQSPFPIFFAIVSSFACFPIQLIYFCCYRTIPIAHCCNASAPRDGERRRRKQRQSAVLMQMTNILFSSATASNF